MKDNELENVMTEEFIETTYLYCYKRLSSHTDAEDLAQEILLEALYCIFLKRRSGQTVSLEVFGENLPLDINPLDDDLIGQEEISELNYAISRLSKIQREVVVLFYLKEMKISEIAGNLNISVGTVKRRLFDIRTNLKKGFETMNNVGRSAYAPATLYKWGSGACPFGAHNDLIIHQLLIACRNEGKTLNELADEIGVAPVYLEDRMKYPLECGTMKVDEKGKYFTNICIIPEQVNYNAIYRASEIYSALGSEITEVLYKKKDFILSLNFHGNKFDYDYLMWLLYIFICGKYGDMALKQNEKNWEGKIAANNGKNFRLAGSFTLADEIINRDKEVKQFGSNNMLESFEHFKYGKIAYINYFRDKPFSNRDSYNMVNGSNAPLVFKLIDNNGIAELNDIEEEQAANLISRGAIVKDGERLNVMIPFMTAECENKIRDCFEDLLQPLVEKYTDKISRMVDEIMLPFIRDDLMEEYAHWIMSNFFWTSPYVYYWAINEGKTIAIPDDYSKSAAGIYMQKR